MVWEATNLLICQVVIPQKLDSERLTFSMIKDALMFISSHTFDDVHYLIELARSAQASHLHWHAVGHLSPQWGRCTNLPATKATHHGCTCGHCEDWLSLGTPHGKPKVRILAIGIMVFFQGKLDIDWWMGKS